MIFLWTCACVTQHYFLITWDASIVSGLFGLWFLRRESMACKTQNMSGVLLLWGAEQLFTQREIKGQRRGRNVNVTTVWSLYVLSYFSLIRKGRHSGCLGFRRVPAFNTIFSTDSMNVLCYQAALCFLTTAHYWTWNIKMMHKKIDRSWRYTSIKYKGVPVICHCVHIVRARNKNGTQDVFHNQKWLHSDEKIKVVTWI